MFVPRRGVIARISPTPLSVPRSDRHKVGPVRPTQAKRLRWPDCTRFPRLNSILQAVTPPSAISGATLLANRAISSNCAISASPAAAHSVYAIRQPPDWTGCNRPKSLILRAIACLGEPADSEAGTRLALDIVSDEERALIATVTPYANSRKGNERWTQKGSSASALSSA